MGLNNKLLGLDEVNAPRLVFNSKFLRDLFGEGICWDGGGVEITGG